MKMSIQLVLFSTFATLCVGPHAPTLGQVAWALPRRLPPPPIHPDTLPTMISSWRLPAALAGATYNSFAPRIELIDGTLYVYDHHGRRLAAVDAQSGKIRWHAPIEARTNLAFATTPFVYKDTVYVGSDGYLHAFNKSDGKLRFRLALKGLPVNGFARAKHRLFVPWIQVKDGKVMPGVYVWGIDTRRGRIEWSQRYAGSMGYVRGNADGAYYVGSDGAVMALTPDRGTVRWKTQLVGRVSQPPQLIKNRLYVASHSGGSSKVSCFDVTDGKKLWDAATRSNLLAFFVDTDRLVFADPSGQLVALDAKTGKAQVELKLRFTAEPVALQVIARDERVYVFSSDGPHQGFVWVADLKRKRVLATANALKQPMHAALLGDKTAFLDADDGDIYAYRLDRSLRPKRSRVPAAEFASELIAKAADATEPLPGLVSKLAGLGTAALSAIEGALDHANPHIVAAAAQTIELLKARRSVPALLRALDKRLAKPATSLHDSALQLLQTITSLRDGRAIARLKKLIGEASQSHDRRRAAYVGLGALGTPAALSAIWKFRAERQVSSKRWSPYPYTTSLDRRVIADTSNDSPSEASKSTLRTTSAGNGRHFSVSLSPYLGGYNDIWIGESDAQGQFKAGALFSGLTKAEIDSDRWVRFRHFKVDTDPKEGDRASLIIEMRRGEKDWVASRPLSIPLAQLSEDSDQDGLPDIVEQRMQLCINQKDCDNDGLSDAEDLNPLASSKTPVSRDQTLFREAFFAFYAFIARRGVVIVDPGDKPSIEFYGHNDPVLALRQPAIERLRKQMGLHGADFVSFGGPYRDGKDGKEALRNIVYDKRGRSAELSFDVARAGNNAVAYNVTLTRYGKNWVVSRMEQVFLNLP